MGQFGIESCIVEPGGYPTAFIHALTQPSDTARIPSYGPVGEMPGGFLKAFEDVFAANPQQDPSKVAEAITDLIAKPHGERPIRTIVDFMGLGTLVKPYNDLLERSNAQLINNFQIGHLAIVKK